MQGVKLTPSSAARWIACPPSASLAALYPQAESQQATAGVFMHEMAADLISEAVHSTSFSIREWRDHEMYTSYAASVAEKYKDYVLDVYDQTRRKYGRANLFVEKKVTFRSLEGAVSSGYIDALILHPEGLIIIDLKTGRTHVPVTRNAQMMLYACGVLDSALSGLVQLGDSVKLTIFQPTAGGASTWTTTSKEILDWRDEVVAPAVVAAKGPKAKDGVRAAGPHCKYCPVRVDCPTAALWATEGARDAEKPEGLAPQRAVEIYTQASAMKSVLTGITDYMNEQAAQGAEFPGMKAIRGSGRRRIIDEKGARRALRAEGLKLGQIDSRKLKGIGELSELMSADDVDRVLGPFIQHKRGAIKLVPLDHPAPQVGSETAAAVFKAALRGEKDEKA